MRRIAIVLAALFVLSACGDDAGSATDANEPVTITLLTHDSFAVSDGLLDGFTEQTGITVKVLQAGDAGEMVNQAILTKGKPLGDVLYGVDNTFLARAVDAGIFEPYSSPAMSDVEPAFADETGDGAVTPIDVADVCLNYDKAWFAEHGVAPPTSLDDLTKPEYKDLLVVENPATSSPGLAFMLGTIDQFGEDGWLDYWKQLQGERRRDRSTAGRTPTTPSSPAARARAPSRIVVSYASSPPAEVVFAETPLTDAPTAVIESTCFRQIEFAGVLAGTAARRRGEGVHRLHAEHHVPGRHAAQHVRVPGELEGDGARRVREVLGRARAPPFAPAGRDRKEPRSMDRRVDIDRARLTHWARRAALLALPVAFLAVFFVWPVAAIISRGISANGFREVFTDDRLRHVAWFTLWQATVSTFSRC